MRVFLGLLVGLSGIAASLWGGLWYWGLGSIMEAFNYASQNTVDRWDVLWYLVMIGCTGLMTSFGVYLSIGIGSGIAGVKPNIKK